MLFWAHDRKNSSFDKYFPGCYILQKFVSRWEKWLNWSPFICASICLYHNQRCSRGHKAKDTKKSEAKDQGHSAEVFSERKKVFIQNFQKFSANCRRSKKKHNKDLRPQIFHKILAVKFFFASSLACSKTKLHGSWPSHIFNRSKNSAEHFQGQAGFEAKDLIFEAKDFKLTKDVLEDSTSGHNHCFFLSMSQILHFQSQYNCMQF